MVGIRWWRRGAASTQRASHAATLLVLRRADGNDRGVTAVEAAIVTPIFMLLIVGVIEFGLAFKDQLAITSAVRAGARIASAEPRQATFATDAAGQVAREGGAVDMTDVKELWVYQADSSGHPLGAGGGFGSCTQNCVHFTWNNTSRSSCNPADLGTPVR